jgi:hypothetical protein
VINELDGALVDLGFTVPGQSWVYWNIGPGPGPSYPDTEHGHQVAGIMARNLYAVAAVPRERPIPLRALARCGLSARNVGGRR